MKGQNGIPLAKNDDIELEISGLTLAGQGVGRYLGFTVFVPGALEGELVRAHIIKVASNYAIGKLVELVQASEKRVEPRCALFGRCGGCAFQHLDYREQLVVKRRLVEDALVRLGGLENVKVEPVLGMDEPWRYRNKGSFPFAACGGVVRPGFFAPRSHRLVPIDDCPIESESIMDVVHRVEEWANSYKVEPYDELSHRGVLRHVVVRVTESGERMAVIVTSGALPHREELCELLGDLDSLYHNVNPRETNVIFGDKFKLLSGTPVLFESINGLDFTVSPNTFLQVNALQTRVLYDRALSLLAPLPTDNVIDLYCGMGSISLLLAQRTARVTGIENVPEAVEDARHNAEKNGLTNCEFLCGDAEELMVRLAAQGAKPDAVVMDPPRKGADPGVLQAIIDCAPNKLLYISCNPATLARDLAILTKIAYRIETVLPVDMFPHTAHVETVVLMAKSGE